MVKVLRYIVILIFLTGCQKEEHNHNEFNGELMEIPLGLDSVRHPLDNQFTLARWTLGKKLFFDPILSVDSTLSCSSCHNPELSFSDDKSLSPGVFDRPGTRNSPSLANIGFHPYFTREGGVPTLEMQVLIPLQEHNEFDFNIVLAAERLQKNTEYVEMASVAYDRLPDHFVITRALACFERSLISGFSRYDQFIHYGKEDKLNESERRGMDLFFSKKTSCSDCHGGSNFTNYEFKNNGLYNLYEDTGRFRLTKDSADLALFKIPSLRNIEVTAPYMHDGSIHTLEEVVEHYNMGGSLHPNKSKLIKPLHLNPIEKQDLVNFLKSLTDEKFLSNENFKE